MGAHAMLLEWSYLQTWMLDVYNAWSCFYHYTSSVPLHTETIWAFPQAACPELACCVSGRHAVSWCLLASAAWLEGCSCCFCDHRLPDMWRSIPGIHGSARPWVWVLCRLCGTSCHVFRSVRHITNRYVGVLCSEWFTHGKGCVMSHVGTASGRICGISSKFRMKSCLLSPLSAKVNGGFVFTPVCLSVFCLSVCEQDI